MNKSLILLSAPGTISYDHHNCFRYDKSRNTLLGQDLLNHLSPDGENLIRLVDLTESGWSKVCSKFIFDFASCMFPCFFHEIYLQNEIDKINDSVNPYALKPILEKRGAVEGSITDFFFIDYRFKLMSQS